MKWSEEWPFLSATLDLVEMVLAKVEPKVTQAYEELLVPAELRPFAADLRARYEATRRNVLRVLGMRSRCRTMPCCGSPSRCATRT